MSTLKRRKWNCALCRFLYGSISSLENQEVDRATFYKVGPHLTSSVTTGTSIGTVYALPGFSPATPGTQLSIPKLSGPGSPGHIKTMIEWMSLCDQDHHCIPKDDIFLPSRVLDLGRSDQSTIRLFCTSRDQTTPGRYIALSHRWGSATQHRKFCTFKANLEQFKQAINVEELPKTFRHAVEVTRSLKVRYLWIDSLCIIQDDREDWQHESKLMEQVFSSAYVTLAATCANGTEDGFLKARPDRQVVNLTRQDGSEDFSYYLSEAIDDFPIDVDQGELNKRGWVLQERALSRRTIYFAEKQTYWECGKGVRCETMTKMKNRKASFLGDSDFPHSVSAFVKGMRIQLLQSLYVRYSTLALSYPIDRPVAIKGLEKRLIRTLDTSGAFGVFEVYLHRCLLWQRAGRKLTRIPEGDDGREKVPSWSCLGYEGVIEYMDVPFGKVDWSKDVVSPFKMPYESQIFSEEGSVLEMRVKAVDILELKGGTKVMDDPQYEHVQGLQCVVIGRQKQLSIDQRQLLYVILVTPEQEENVYKRAGVAILEKRNINMAHSIDIRLQ